MIWLGDFPEMGECPINAISFINDSDHSINIFLLRNEKNPLIAEFEKEVASGIYKELQDFIIKCNSKVSRKIWNA